MNTQDRRTAVHRLHKLCSPAVLCPSPGWRTAQCPRCPPTSSWHGNLVFNRSLHRSFEISERFLFSLGRANMNIHEFPQICTCILVQAPRITARLSGTVSDKDGSVCVPLHYKPRPETLLLQVTPPAKKPAWMSLIKTIK